MKEEYSAGGVVFKKGSSDSEILVSQHSLHHGWVFPKGHIGDTIANETKEAAAIREVREETGIEGNIVQSLQPVEYEFELAGEKIHKTVYYFLMEYVGGNSEHRDYEMEQVEWLPMDSVSARLTFESDQSAWEEARDLIEK